MSDLVVERMVHSGQPVPEQIRFRAAIAHAACPELPIDTDDWPAPDLATWRENLALKPGHSRFEVVA